MFPLGDVVAASIAVVLERDDGEKVLRLQIRIKLHDFIIERHYADLTKAALK